MPPVNQALADALKVPITGYNSVVAPNGRPVAPAGQGAPEPVTYSPGKPAPTLPKPTNVAHPDGNRDIGKPVDANTIKQNFTDKEIEQIGDRLAKELTDLYESLKKQKCVIKEYKIEAHGTLGGIFAGPGRFLPKENPPKPPQK